MSETETLRHRLEQLMERLETSSRSADAKAHAVIDEALQRITDLEAQVSALTAQEWQPIETAPKDGRRIAACVWDADAGRWVVGYIYWWVSSQDIGHWIGGVNQPTHWMPLPAPPGDPVSPAPPER